MIDNFEPRVITDVVRNDLCIGCGVCVPACPTHSLKMVWSNIGIYEPAVAGACTACNKCIEVCPFSIDKKESNVIFNEDSIKFNPTKNKVSHNENLGSYQDLLVGYSLAHRDSSSSGGVATWFMSEILKRKIVDAVFCVSPVDDVSSDIHFDYVACHTNDEILQSSKTRYYPVKVDKVIEHILNNDGSYALIGLPCTIKALRLAQSVNSDLRERLKVIIGIFCGGLKTKYYTEYLASAAGCPVDDIKYPQYRIKNTSSSADDYSFGCEDSVGNNYTVQMKSLGDMWGTGLFKPNACDYCDDLSSELADASFGDAWIPPYRAQGEGNSLVIVRSNLANLIVNEGMQSGALNLQSINYSSVNDSQRGNINHRRKGLSFRLFLAKISKKIVPEKRVAASVPINPIFNLIQILRINVRDSSNKTWLSVRDSGGYILFNRKMHKRISCLKLTTKFSHFLGSQVHAILLKIRIFLKN